MHVHLEARRGGGACSTAARGRLCSHTHATGAGIAGALLRRGPAAGSSRGTLCCRRTSHVPTALEVLRPLNAKVGGGGVATKCLQPRVRYLAARAEGKRCEPSEAANRPYPVVRHLVAAGEVQRLEPSEGAHRLYPVVRHVARMGNVPFPSPGSSPRGSAAPAATCPRRSSPKTPPAASPSHRGLPSTLCSPGARLWSLRPHPHSGASCRFSSTIPSSSLGSSAH